MTFAVRIASDPAREMAIAFASFALDHTGPLYLAVSGGTTPRDFFRHLVGSYRDALPWSRMHLFQVDERCVSPEDAQSNWRMINEEIVSQVTFGSVRPMEAESDSAVEEYIGILNREAPSNERGVPRFDLVLLGMGADGHTASLFPGSTALEERTRPVTKVYVESLDSWRVTLTLPVLQAAARRWFLLRGEDKAPAFAEVRQGHLPAGNLLPASVWFMDPAAAGET